MSEKKWTDDERDEAFDRGMETMQRVALDLYRRGREPLLEELEEARARNADMRTMLEQVTRERDEARADLARSVAAWESAGMQGRTAHDAMLALAKERDEALAEVERLKRWIYRTRKESLENKGEEITDDPASLLHSMFYEIVDGRVDRLDSFRRGAEAMREACAEKVGSYTAWSESPSVEFLEEQVRALPIPEEP